MTLTDLSEDVVELQTKIAALVRSSYGGDYKQAFDHYDADRTGIDADQLKQLLSDADIGNIFTRGSWVSGIMDKLDVNRDGRIAWDEFEGAVKAVAKEP
jgi:Ca2+-binding EF-hand superfamily protein